MPGSDGIEDCECKRGTFGSIRQKFHRIIDTFTDYSQNEIVTQNVFSAGNHGNVSMKSKKTS